MSRAPVLVFGIGNPSRGDDALGPRFIDLLAASIAASAADSAADSAAAPAADSAAASAADSAAASLDLECLTDFQLQIEHALDLVGRRLVIFVDASVSAPAPFRYQRVWAARDASHSSHAMSPQAVLETYQRVVGEPPEAWTLEIRGDRFELGEPIGEPARANLSAALAFFLSTQGRATSRLL